MSIRVTFKGVLNIGIRILIIGHFGPKIDHNSDLQSFPQIFFIRFTPFILVLHAYWGTLMCILMTCPKGSIFGSKVKFVAEDVRPSCFYLIYLHVSNSALVFSIL